MAELSDNQLKNLNNQLVQMDKNLAQASDYVNKFIDGLQKAENVQGLRNLLHQLEQIQAISKNGLRIVDPKTLNDLDSIAKMTKEKLSSIAPTLSGSFQRVINEIETKSQRSGEQFAKKIVNADAIKKELARAFLDFKAKNPMSFLSEGKLQNIIKNGGLGMAQIFSQEGLAARPQLLEIFKRYQLEVQKSKDLQDQFTQSQKRFTENINKVEQVELGYKRVGERLTTLSQKWDELNVKKQAGLIGEKDFTSQAGKIISEYDKLIGKANQYHEANRSIGDMSFRQRRLSKETTNLVNQDKQQNAYKKMADSSGAMQIAIKKQVEIQNRLNQLRKEYNTLNQKLGRTKEENEALERRRKKIIELINLSKRLNQEQKGSASLGRILKDYDQMKTKIKQSTDEAKKATINFDKMRNSIVRLGSVFGVAFSVQGLVQFGKKLIETRGMFELQQVALRSILQNKELADEIWAKTMNQALQSPFTAMQLTKYTKQLAAYRIENEKLFDTTKMLADVSAGLGVDMQRLILAYGQVKAANYLRASEIRQFTEAGVNILGELANYFSETRGQMYSTGQVMDMVRKRMVLFSDVTEIFKRLTNEGGIFYNMQYVQSQTVKGQIAKLHDAYDQMLNSIGKSNEGTIKKLIGALNSLVQNWRNIATVIKSIAWATAIGWLSKYAMAILGIGKVSATTKRGLVSMKLAVEGLGKAIKANWITLAIAAATYAISSMIESARDIKQINEEIDEQITNLYNTSERIKGYQSSIEENNKTIRGNSKDTSDNTEKQKKLQDALDGNRSILSKLQSDYPQLAAGLKLNTDGTIDLTKALEDYNHQLEREMQLLALKEGEDSGFAWGWFSDVAEEDMADAVKDLSKVQSQLRNIQLKLKTELAKAEIKGTVDENQREIVQRFLAIPTEGDMEDAIEQAYALRKEYQKKWTKYIRGGDIGNGTLVNTGEFEIFVKEWNLDSIEHATEELESELEQIGWLGSNGDLGKLELDFITDLETFEQFAKQISDEYSGDIAKFIANNSKQIQDAVEGNVEKGIASMPEIVKSIGTSLKSVGKATTPEMRALYNRILNDRIVFTKENERLNEIDAQIAAEKAKKVKNQNQQLLNELAAQRRKFIKENSIDFFADESLDTETTDNRIDNNNGDKKQLDSISRLISLLKEMNSEYDKLSKSAYGYVAANEKVRESYRDAFKEIFKAKYGTKGRYELDKAFTMINWDEVDVTNKRGVANAMKKLRDYMDTNDIWKHYSKETRAELEKAISGMEVETEIQVHARIRDDFKREMEQMFSNYDLTSELQGLKINPQQAKDLFPDFEETTIGQLQDELEEFYQRWNTKGKDGKALFSEEDLEAYSQMSDKIADGVLKMQKEKAKEYSKYFEQELSERAKLEMKYAEDIAFVRANISDETRRSNIEANLGKKYAEDLHELEWKSFKESDFYVEMMDDISSLPATYTKLMMAKLNEILANPQTLSPRALKEAIKAREKIMQSQIDLQPLNVMRESKTSINEAKKDKKVGASTWTETRKNIDKEITANQKEINARKERISILETERGQMKKYEEAVEEVTNAEKTLSKTTKDWLDENEGDIGRTLSEMKTQYDTNKDQIKEIRDLQLKGNTDSTLNDELTRLQEQNATLKNQIPYVEKLVEKYSALSTVISTIQQSETGGTTMGMIESGVTSADIGEEAQQSSEKVDELERRNANLKKWRKAFEDFLKSYASFNKAQADMLGHLKDMNNAWYDTYVAIGGETDVLTDAWKEFGNTLVDTITSALSLIPTMVTKIVFAEQAINAAAGIIGLIAEAIQLVITLVGALAKVNDAGYEKEIQAQQKAVDNLSHAYERLEKAIDRTLRVSQYMRTFHDSLDNIQQQIQATSQQLQAESSKKDSDEDKIREYEDNIEELYDKERELRQKMIEDMGGIGEDNYRSWAEGFVSAWKDAFLETGDGLDALQEHFDEFLQDWFVKQATMRIAGKALERVMGDIDNAVSDDGTVSWSQLQAIKDRMNTILPNLNDALTAFAGSWDLQDSGSLSGLAAGIQGITEEQANILEAYWNSVRLYTASIDANVAAIANVFGVGTGVNTNPMLQQLTLTAQHTNDILLLLESVRTNNGSGNGIRVISV